MGLGVEHVGSSHERPGKPLPAVLLRRGQPHWLLILQDCRCCWCAVSRGGASSVLPSLWAFLPYCELGFLRRVRLLQTSCDRPGHSFACLSGGSQWCLSRDDASDR